MYQNRLFRELLERFVSGEISPEDKLKLLGMLDNQQYREEFDAFLKENYDSVEFDSEDIEATQRFVEKLRTKINLISKSEEASFLSKFKWKKIAIAASVLLLIGLGTYFITQKEIKKQNQLVLNNVKNDKDPGKFGAILTLSNGSKLVLDSLSDGLLADQSNTKVSKKNGAIVYASANEAKTVYNTLTTPKAHQYNLELSDGTKIWLNAYSSITFPTSFTTKERRVVITGEVYFEVAKDKKRPFLVAVNNMEINVLGTHFNVNAYQDEDVVSTTLLEGSVLIAGKDQKLILKPGQQAQKDKAGGIVVNDNVNIDKVMGWKNGVFYFQNASIQEVMRQLSRWYDVDVVFEKGVESRTFEGEIQRDLKLSQVLKILEKNKIHFEIDGKILKVKH